MLVAGLAGVDLGQPLVGLVARNVAGFHPGGGTQGGLRAPSMDGLR